jgi:hypothetical protein
MCNNIFAGELGSVFFNLEKLKDGVKYRRRGTFKHFLYNTVGRVPVRLLPMHHSQFSLVRIPVTTNISKKLFQNFQK